MSFMMQAIYSLPYEPSLDKQDRIRHLVNERGLKLVQTSSPRTVFGMGTVDEASKAKPLAELIGKGLCEVLDCHFGQNKVKLYVTALGDRESFVLDPIGRQDSLPVRRLPSLRLAFAASWKPEAAKAVLSLFQGKERVFYDEAAALDGCETVNEAQYDALQLGLERTVQFLDKECGLSPAGVTLLVSSPAELVIKQLRGSWNIREPRLLNRAVECQKLLVKFGHENVTLQVPGEAVR